MHSNFIDFTKHIFLSEYFDNITFTECSPSSAPKQNDVYIVNLALSSDVQVKKEVNKVPEQPQSLNLHRVSGRFAYRRVTAVLKMFFFLFVCS